MSNESDAKKAQPGSVPVSVKIALWMAGVLLCLALPVIVALHSPSVQRRIISEGIGRLEKATHLKVKISSYRWNIFSSIYLTGVKIESGGKRVLDCDDIRLDYRLSIERPYIVIEEVDFNKPFVRLERGADGKWGLPVFSQKKSGGTSGPSGRSAWTRFHFPLIKVLAGTIEAVQQGNAVLSIRDFSGAVNIRALEGAGGPKFRMELGKLHARAHTTQFGAWVLDGSASLDGSELAARNVVLSGPNACRILVRGRWNIEKPENGEAKLSVSNFSGADIPFLHAKLGRLSAVSGNIDIKRRAGKWTLAPDVSTNIGAVKGVLDIEQTGAGACEVALDSRFSGLKVHLSQDLPDSKLNGRMKIEALMRGERLLKADFDAHLDPSVVCARKVDLCDLRGTYANSFLKVIGAEAKCPLADFKFKVNADLQGLTDSSHAGGIEAEINLLRGNLNQFDPRLRDTLAGRIGIQARYNPGDFANPRLWQEKIDANLAVPGVLTVKASASYDKQLVKAVYDLALTDAQKIALIFPKWQGKGRVVSHGAFDGKWPELAWSGEIDSPHFGYANCQADRLSIEGKGIVAGKKERHVLRISAQNVVADGKKLASVNLELDQQKNSCAFTFSGGGILDQISARLSGKLDGIWDFPHVSVSTRGMLGWKKLSGAVDAKFVVGQNGIKIGSASFRYGKAKISAAGGAITESSVNLPLSLDSIDAGKLSELLDLKTRLSGTVSGRLQVSGRPDRPECKLSLQGNNLLYSGQKIERLTLHGDYSKKLLTVEGTAKAPGVSDPISVSGRVPVQLSLDPPRFELIASGKLDSDLKFSGLGAKAILPLFRDVLAEAGGQLDGNIRCGGTLEKPVFSGDGMWKEGAFELKFWPHVAQHIRATWRIDSNALYLTSANISHLGGTVSVEGKIEYPGFETFDLQARGQDLKVPHIFGIRGRAAGHAEIKATPEAEALTGTLHLTNGRLDLEGLETNLTQHKTIQVVESIGSGNLVELKGAEGPSRFLNNLAVDLKIELPQSGSWVNGKGLKAEINGGIKLVKKSGGPLLVAGELHALRGVYSFHGKQLDIVDGSVIFPGAPHTEPQLRIVCRKDIRDVTVQGLVSGPIKHPKLVLSSIPAMNQVDILSYFMFGHPASDLSTDQSSQLQSGLAALLGAEGPNIVKSVLGDSIIAPDTINYRSFTDNYNHIFSFDQSQADIGKETGIVELGKDVTPNLHVVYGREVTGVQGSGNEARVEYRLNKSISFSSQVGGEQTGADIFWRHDFGK